MKAHCYDIMCSFFISEDVDSGVVSGRMFCKNSEGEKMMKKKKFVSCLLVLAVGASLLAVCGSKG